MGVSCRSSAAAPAVPACGRARLPAARRCCQTSHALRMSSSSVLMLVVVCPGGGLVVAGPGLQAAVQDADQAVAQLAQGGMVAGAPGAEGVVVGACAG